MIRLTQFAVREKSVIILLAVAVMIAGLVSWNSLRQELLPDIEFPFVTVITPVPGAGAEDVATQVTDPVERAIANIPRLETVQSTSGNSLSLVFAEFAFVAFLFDHPLWNHFRLQWDARWFWFPVRRESCTAIAHRLSATS